MSTPAKSPTIQELRAARAGQAKKPKGARRGRGWWITGGLLIALVLFGFFGLPTLVKARAVKELSTRLGRDVTIEKVRINPLVLSVTIEGFAIAEADRAAGEFTGWRRVYVNFNSWSLFGGGLGFSEIAVDGFRARVARGRDGGLNFDDIVARLAADTGAGAKAAPAASGEAAKAPKIFVGKLDVTDARISFDDASPARPFATVLGPLQFTLRDFHTVGDPNAPYSFEAATASGERLAWKGNVSIDPIRSEGELALTGLDLARLSPYFEHRITGELRSALLDVAGRYTLELRDALPVVTVAEGAVTLRDLRFGAPGSAEDALAVKSVTVTGIRADSAGPSADILRVVVEGVKVKARRDASGIDLQGLLAPRAGAGATVAATPAPAGASGAPAMALPKVTLAEFLLSGVQVDVTDLTTPRPAQHRIDDVKLTVRDLSSVELGRAIPFELTVALPQDGRVQLAGTATPQPLAANLAMELVNVPFANASPYVEPLVNVRLADGVARAKGFAVLENGALTYTGDFGIERFATVDGKLAQDFVKWTALAVTGIRLTSEPMALAVEEIRLTDPVATLRIESDGSLNIAQAAAPASAPAAPEATVTFPKTGAKPAAVGATPPISIGRVVLENAAFRYEDLSVKPAARGALTEFGGTITGLSSSSPARADLDLRGKIDGSAPLAVTGKLNPLGTPASADVKISLRGMDLQPGAGPYVGKFAGFELARGNLNVEVDFKLQDRAIKSTNVITFDQFYLGAKTSSPEATKLPVSLALALLRDGNGKIVLDPPIAGSLDDPEFKIGRMVVRIIGNVLTKAATSPFSLLGAAFGGGGDELGYQEFAAGVSAVDTEGMKKLATVSKALIARPALNIDLEGAYDAAGDGAVLRRAQLDAQIRAAAWEARRAVDPNTPPPEQLEITPELRAGMLARLHAAAVAGAPAVSAVATETAGATAEPKAGVEVAAAPVSVEEDAKRRTALPVELASPRENPRAKIMRPIGRLPQYFPAQGTAKANAAPEARSKAEPAVEFKLSEAKDAAAGVATTGAATADGGAAAVAPTLTTEELEAALMARIEISEESLRALADARAQAVRTWLVDTGKVPAERVFLGAPTAKGARVQLNLR